ncbi:hypothetical protein [Paludisphaera borealis]|uniref:Uncharacterized protein n=1 Tax=Paludisphaera borealis TaxID=1387353 RepID=A0A1U7CTG9_9BACT|nr:hypothetical protein [Paludisphaera borealis]APW62196.1 hypothetical protein BSF38_03728 [Paludisphaera borealis]
MESESSDPRNLSISTLPTWAATAVVGVLGVLAVHHPMLLSGFGRIQTDRGDTRLLHYLLEHGYLWVVGAPGHRDFWSAPFFHPLTNVIAYSDSLLSFGPFYWTWRFAGASPDLAFGLWMTSMTVLNYAAGLLLFGGGLGFGAPATVAAASLLAFGAPRVNQLEHQQLLPFFYVLLTLYAFARLFREDSPSPGRRLRLWMLAAFGGAAQLYGGVYLGWFLVMALVLTTITALAVRSSRGAVLAVARRDWWAVAAATAAGVLVMQPFLAHYLPAAREMRSVYLPFRYYLHPTFGSWWNVGKDNWFWGWLIARRPFVGSLLENEHRLGLGFITTAVCAAGLYLGRRQPWCQVAIWFLFLCLLATSFLPGRELIVVAACLCCYGFGCLLRQTDEPLITALTFVVVLGVLVGVPFPNPWLKAMSLAFVVPCLWKIGVERGEADGWVLPAIAVGLVCLKLFALEVVAIMAVPIAPAAGLLAYYLPARRWEIGFGAVATMIVALSLLTFGGRLEVLIGGVAGGLAGVAVGAPQKLRPPPLVLLRVLAVSLAVLALLYDADSLWLGYSLKLPGALAIRAVGRIVLILMIPAALGLAVLVERLARDRSAALAWTVALICLAEQTVTTPAFDAAANRAKIAGVAGQVAPTAAAFYYKPCEDEPFVHYGLDAMWASLAVGVPTINGYTGYYPSAWYGFLLADSEVGLPLKVLLERWEADHGLRAEDVQRIGGDLPRPDARKQETPIGSQASN